MGLVKNDKMAGDKKIKKPRLSLRAIIQQCVYDDKGDNSEIVYLEVKQN